MNPTDSLKTRPGSVALIGLGASHAQLVETVCADACKMQWEETWTVNFGMNVFRHDKLWVMDDLRRQAETLPSYGDALRRHDRPIITSTAYPEYPMSVGFPIAEVLQAIGDDFLNSTVAYAIAYAMMTKVKELWLFGCDFHYPNQTRAEEGGQCATYLLGLARHFGMQFKIPPTTTLMGAYHGKRVGDDIRRPLYGYAKQPFIPEDGDAAQPGPGPQVREDRRDDRDAPHGSPPSDVLHGGGQPGHLGTGRENLLRRGPGGDGNPGVVLEDGSESCSGAAQEVAVANAWRDRRKREESFRA